MWSVQVKGSLWQGESDNSDYNGSRTIDTEYCFNVGPDSMLCLGVTVQMRYGQQDIIEGGTTLVCASLTGVVERNVIVRLETSQTGSAEATGEYTIFTEQYYLL